ncbi:MAG: FadR family transcriptional regulator [Peptococcaceae bacterium]|nr:FadR family transcriptional regulator [Peptococcaceae bacterium]
MEFIPVKVKRAVETIIDQIKNHILSGELQPGDKLLTERELAEHLKVSRASVREALSALNMAGILEIKHGEGIYLKKLDSQSVIEPLTIIMLLERDKIKNILEVRKALEVESAGLAAERHRPGDLEKIKAALAEMEEDLVTGNTGEQADLKFHFAIARSTTNPLLIMLMNTIHDAMNQTLKATRQLWLSSTSGTTRRLFEEHRDIFSAIAARDKEKAREIMYQHLYKVETELEKMHKIYREMQGAKGNG